MNILDLDVNHFFTDSATKTMTKGDVLTLSHDFFIDNIKDVSIAKLQSQRTKVDKLFGDRKMSYATYWNPSRSFLCN